MKKKDFKNIHKKYNLNEDDFCIFHDMWYYTTNDRKLAHKISNETNGTILYKMPVNPDKEFWTIRWPTEREPNETNTDEIRNRD